MPREAPPTGGVERARDRARKFGRDHTKPQKPEPVTVVLTIEQAPTVTINPSPHPTKVMYAPVGSPDEPPQKPVAVTELPAGVGATLSLGKDGWAVTSTKDVRTPQKPS